MKELTDHNGRYLKTLCYVVHHTNFDEANRGCLKNGMDLINVDSPDVREGFLNWFKSNWATNANAAVWYYGVSDAGCFRMKNHGEVVAPCNQPSDYVCEFGSGYY